MFWRKPRVGFRIQVVVEPDDKGFHAYCPALKGLHTYGDTEAEALQNVKDAAIAYLRSSIRHGDPIPVGITHEHMGKMPDVKDGQVVRHTEDLEVACVT